MADTLAAPRRKAALKIVAYQGVFALLAATLVSLIWGVHAGSSALAGGLIAVLPNFVFTLYAFRFVGASKTNMVYMSFKRGMVLKFFLTTVMFVFVFKELTVLPVFIFSIYLLVNLAQWLLSISFNH